MAEETRRIWRAWLLTSHNQLTGNAPWCSIRPIQSPRTARSRVAHRGPVDYNSATQIVWAVQAPNHRVARPGWCCTAGCAARCAAPTLAAPSAYHARCGSVRTGKLRVSLGIEAGAQRVTSLQT